MLDNVPDPALRWQILRDLHHAPASDYEPVRAKVATEGAGAKLLALQQENGAWANAAWNRGWTSTMHALMLLRDLGLPPASPEAIRALRLVREHVTWENCGPAECRHNRFFEGEIEPCINAQVAAVGAYFAQDVHKIIQRLLGEQQPDGGWNCEAASGSKHSSFNTTICVLEALLASEQSGQSSPKITEARHRGEEYLLNRHLFRRLSTGEPIEKDRKGGARWTQFANPTWWHYDILRALDYLRAAEIPNDPRLTEALAILESKRTQDNNWLLEVVHPGTMPVEIEEASIGQPSSWLTLRARRVQTRFPL